MGNTVPELSGNGLEEAGAQPDNPAKYVNCFISQMSFDKSFDLMFIKCGAQQ